MSKIDITNLTISNISELTTEESSRIEGGTVGKTCGTIGGFAGNRRAFKSLGCGVGIGSAPSISAPIVEVPAIEVPSIEVPSRTPVVSATACIDGSCDSAVFTVANH
jgi:hypothetical protein